jgi:hypothetical protein
MKIGTFMVDDGPTFGLVLGDRWLDIPAAAGIFDGAPPGNPLLGFVAVGESSIAWGNRLQSAAVSEPERFAGAWHPLKDAKFLPPFYPGGRLFTQRGNSCLFSRSVNLALPEHPVWERRYTTNLVGHNHVSDRVGSGWNPEFVAIIGQGGRDIPPGSIIKVEGRPFPPIEIPIDDRRDPCNALPWPGCDVDFVTRYPHLRSTTGVG